MASSAIGRQTRGNECLVLPDNILGVLIVFCLVGTVGILSRSSGHWHAGILRIHRGHAYMNHLILFAIVCGTFVAMEWVAWASHRYLSPSTDAQRATGIVSARAIGTNTMRHGHLALHRAVWLG